MLRLLIISMVLIVQVRAKVFSECELLEELIDVQNASVSSAKSLLCVAHISSNYSTEYSRANYSFGIFNISRNQIELCNISVESLRDDDIEDDFNCAFEFSDFEASGMMIGDKSCDEFANDTLEDCFKAVEIDLTKFDSNQSDGENHLLPDAETNSTMSSNELSNSTIYNFSPSYELMRTDKNDVELTTMKSSPEIVKAKATQLEPSSREHLGKLDLIQKLTQSSRENAMLIFLFV